MEELDEIREELAKLFRRFLDLVSEGRVEEALATRDSMARLARKAAKSFRTDTEKLSELKSLVANCYGILVMVNILSVLEPSSARELAALVQHFIIGMFEASPLTPSEWFGILEASKLLIDKHAVGVARIQSIEEMYRRLREGREPSRSHM